MKWFANFQEKYDRQKLCRTFLENTKVYVIVSHDTVAYAWLGNCVAALTHSCLQGIFLAPN